MPQHQIYSLSEPEVQDNLLRECNSCFLADKKGEECAALCAALKRWMRECCMQRTKHSSACQPVDITSDTPRGSSARPNVRRDCLSGDWHVQGQGRHKGSCVLRTRCRPLSCSILADSPPALSVRPLARRAGRAGPGLHLASCRSRRRHAAQDTAWAPLCGCSRGAWWCRDER